MRQQTFRVAVRKFGPFESAIAKQWEAFEREATTGLQLEAVPMDLHPLYESTLAQPKGSDWDVVFVNTDWMASAHHDGALLDLAPLIAAGPPDDYPGGWSQSLLRLQDVEGAVLGLPYHDGPECLIYRKDIIEQPPETWDDFKRLAREHRTIFAAFPDGHNTVYDYCLQLWTRGGELFEFDSPPSRDALAFLREMVNDATAVDPRCREMDSVQSGLAFAAGEAALMVNWFGFAAMAETVADSRVKGKVAIAPVPHAPGARGTSLNIYWILSIPVNAAHRDVAWRFIRHCASAAMDKLLTLEGAIGCRKSTWVDEEVNRIVPFYCGMEELHANAREMPRLKEWPRIAEVIDRMVMAAINTDEAIEEIAQRGQAEVGLLLGK